jgi:hypothetical protein
MSKNLEADNILLWEKCNFTDKEVKYLHELAQNSALSALATTTTIGVVKLPIEKYFLNKAQNKELKINYQSIRNAGLFAGYRVFVQSNMPRSCYLISSKNHNKAKEHDVNEHTQENNASNSELHAKLKSSKFLSIGTYAAVETLFTHYSDQKITLAQLNINYSKTLLNKLKLFNSCLGIRFLSSAVNLICLTSIQAEALKLLSHDDKKPASLFQYLASGMVSGAISGVSTYPLRQIHTQVNAQAHHANHKLIFPTPYNVAKINLKKMLKDPIQQTLTCTAKGMTIRTLQSCFVFCSIFGVEHTLGKTPANDLKKFCGIQ